MNFDEMADKLSAHPDFKVKRRLVPILDFGPGSGAPTKRVLILDTETTGLDWRAENIIELAMLSVAVDMQTGQPVGVVEVYEDFEDPGRPIPAEIVMQIRTKWVRIGGGKISQLPKRTKNDKPPASRTAHRAWDKSRTQSKAAS